MPDEIPKEGSFKKRRAAVILLIFFVTGAVLGVRWWYNEKTNVATDDSFVDAHIYPISSRVPGHVKAVLVDDNQQVKKGGPLVLLDTADYAAKVDENKASVIVTENQIASDYAALDSANEAVKLAEAKLELAESELIRGDELFVKGYNTKQDIDRLETDKKVAVAQLNDARKNVRKVEAQIGLAVKGGKEAQVAQEKAKLEQARLNLSYTKIVSPADGYVTRKSVEPGSNIQAGQPLMAVVQLGDPWVTANYKESQLTYVRPGQPVDFTVDAYPGHVFRGRIDSIMAGTGAAFSLLPPENATGNFVKIVQRVPVKITIDKASDPEHLLRVGMSVVPTIITGKKFGEVVKDAFR